MQAVLFLTTCLCFFEAFKPSVHDSGGLGFRVLCFCVFPTKAFHDLIQQLAAFHDLIPQLAALHDREVQQLRLGFPPPAPRLLG